MSVIDKIHMLKKIIKEVDRIVAWQSDIYTALHNIDADWLVSGQFSLSRMPRAASGLFLEGDGIAADPIYNALIAANIPNLNASKITTGTFPVARGGTGLSTLALGGILYISALNTLSRLAPTAVNQVLRSTAANALQFAALLAADIPNLDAAKITSGQFSLSRMPRAASGLFLEGNGAAADPIYNILVAANIPNLDASKITTGRFPMTRMPDMALNKIMVGQGAGNSPVEEDKGNIGIPSGLIAMWHGTIANIPSGWVICDGNNSTPNLLTRFVEGVATAATDPGATGGSTSKSHSSHKHTMPTHTHGLHTQYNRHGEGAGKVVDVTETDAEDPGDTNNATVSAHSDIRPLFYDVAFLMKT